jgi:hypothetical protein
LSATDGRVGEGYDGCHHFAELAGHAVVETLLAPPCIPALLADRAVPVQEVC